MNKPDSDTKTKESRNAAPAAAQNNTASAHSGSLSSGLALILSIIALLACVYLGYTFIQKRGIYRADMFSRLDKLEDETALLLNNTSTIGERLNAIKETQDTLKTNVEKFNSELSKGRNEWLLAETEQLILTANYRLQLARDVNLALAALRAADRQLEQLANPRYLPVRKSLADEISSLEALERIDISGMTLHLASLSTRINDLPFSTDTKFDSSDKPAGGKNTDAGSTSMTSEMWQDFISLIRIRRSHEIRQPLLPPEQLYFLRENLRLMLNSAQLALLRGDAGTFQQNLKNAKQWIKDYYNNNAQMVQTVQAELDQMLKINLKTALPDISGSLEQLRRLSGKKANS